MSSIMVFKDKEFFFRLVHETANNLISAASHKMLYTLDNHGPVTGKKKSKVEELQEQLMKTVIEKQQIANELKNLKEEQMKALTQQLRFEKEKNSQLIEEIKKPTRKISVRHKNNLYKCKSMTTLNQTNFDTGRELEPMEEDSEENEETLQSSNSTEDKDSTWTKFTQDWIGNCMQSVRHDFSEITDTNSNNNGDPYGEPVSISKLRRNIIRTLNALDPLTDFGNDLYSVFRWKKPSLTFCVFMVYMYCVYQGLLITFTLSIVTFIFIYAYIRQKEWNGNSELSGKKDSKESEISSIGLREEIAVFLQISRRAQNISGKLCDVAEKLKNLILWKQPELTKQALFGLIISLCGSFIFSTSTICALAGYYMGIRIFLIEIIFSRFPRVKQKYDVLWQIYSQLMSDVELQKKLRKQSVNQKNKNSIKSSNLVTSRLISFSTPNLNQTGSDLSIASNEASISSSTFSESFNVSSMEKPLPPWHDGRKCMFVNKHKSFTSAFRVGRMYLTNNYLCFERLKQSSHKNMVIPLDTVSKIDKAKLVTWLPGGGKALEVRAKGYTKRLLFIFQTQLFGAIVNRDEAYESIMDIGRRHGYHWAI